jgi:hypothetical protein
MTRARIAKERPYYADELGLAEYGHVLRGVYVGACVEDDDAYDRWRDNNAHAHNHVGDIWFGWICIYKPEAVLTPTGLPTTTLLHELAHLLVPGELHTRAWKKAITDLGAGAEIVRCKFKPL